MTQDTPRFFESDVAIREVGGQLLARSLPRADWTHEAHLAACCWIISERPEISPETDMRSIISRYNEAVGIENTDHQGYHETITQIYIAAVRAHLAEQVKGSALHVIVNNLLLSSRGQRDLPLRHYSRERLFSVQARRSFVEPDLMPLAHM